MQAQDIAALYRCAGHIAYEGEGVTQLQHGWQCAQLAQQAGATASLQLAAWLHDLGHLMTGLEGSPTTFGINDSHEQQGAAVLATIFGDTVAQPVALHVQAKRYLVGTQPGYRKSLSPDSVRSLALQGGPMDGAQAACFIAKAHARDALALRVWDDLAKQAGWQPPSVQDALDELAIRVHRQLDGQAEQPRYCALASLSVPSLGPVRQDR